jgi:hypothetical protein
MLFGTALVVQSFQRPNESGAAEAQPVHLGHIVAWTIVAVIMWNGFSRHATMSTRSDETVSLFAVMSRHQQVSSAPVFRGGHMTAVMGRTDLDLRKTTVAAGEEAVIEVFTLLGGATLRVPEGWNVVVQAAPIVGGVKDRRTGSRDVAGAPRIIIRGFIMAGGLEIRS